MINRQLEQRYSNCFVLLTQKGSLATAVVFKFKNSSNRFSFLLIKRCHGQVSLLVNLYTLSFNILTNVYVDEKYFIYNYKNSTHRILDSYILQPTVPILPSPKRYFVIDIYGTNMSSDLILV